MPFIADNFAMVSGHGRKGAGGEASPGAPQIFSYRTQDAHATVDTAGYFNPVRGLLERGDMIDVVVVDANGAVQTYGRHIVMTKSATSVDVSNVTVGTVTNSD
ncbi:hypothetical protein [Roseococcus thiosulfatophilus]|uniref:hypothetical protein n=1 Tax=Roseococcus thiosulfatophilus TaxID=35813 RepID=UPI001A8E3E63|nr:hypothetical protein [Roseococcus thiosulfatophilus]